MKIKLSLWWDENTKPVHPGVYKTILVWIASGEPMALGWSYWSGSKWGDTCNTKEEAAQCCIQGGQDKKWQEIVS